ncbi:MAG: ABC transporter permease [Chloroflexi bacterium]|nr:ABC transporter permease [Chloroflexota bacterium]
MKLLAITLKDLRRSFRSLFSITFMFGVPLLVTALFWFIFGSFSGGEEEGFTLPPTTVQVVNLDEGQTPDTGESLGAVVVDLLQSEGFATLMAVTEAPDEAEARAAVGRGEAGVALVLPADFTASLTGPGMSTTVGLYTDPGLTIGTQVVAAVVRQLVDNLAARTISAEVTLAQLHEAGLEPDAALIDEVVRATQAETAPVLNVATPGAPEAEGEEDGGIGLFLAVIMGGMMVFYAFFTGASAMQTILVEDEEGTLPRLFTTPTPRAVIIAGKALAVVVTLVVQVTVLLLLGNLVFGIDWGEGLLVALAAAGLVMVAATTGLFLISFLKNRRQAGVLFGGVLTLTGMLGLVSVFTVGSPQAATMERVSLLVPQGWAIRAFQIAQGGATGGDLALTLGALLAWSLVFAVIGIVRLQRRFA